MRKIIMIIIALATIFAISVNASAASESGYGFLNSASPYYQTASNVVSTLTITGTTAKCESKVVGHSDVTKCTIQQTLEKHSGWFWIWNNVDGANWTYTITSSSAKVTNNISGLSNGTYRLKSVFTLTTSSGKSETITVYSSEKTIS